MPFRSWLWDNDVVYIRERRKTNKHLLQNTDTKDIFLKKMKKVYPPGYGAGENYSNQCPPVFWSAELTHCYIYTEIPLV